MGKEMYMKQIPVVMTTDKNYILPTKAAVCSILDSAGKDTFYELHIMCDENLDEASRNSLLELTSRYESIHTQFHEIRSAYLDEAAVHAYVPVASYYRLFISQVIDADKCIFIDGDTIVTGDLGMLYDTDLDGSYVAGVRDTAVQTGKKEFLEHEKQLGIPALDGYINAGVMVLNLKKIRDDGMDRIFIHAIKDGYRFMDQDIINKFCAGKIKYLPVKYNYFTEYYEHASPLEQTGFSASELRDIDHAVIFHYVGTFKPWLCTRLKVRQLWWCYAQKAFRPGEYEEQRKAAGQFEKESDWTYILHKTEHEKEIILAGFSETGREIMERLSQWKADEIVCFCDNDTARQGQEYGAKRVLSVSDAVARYPQAYWVITSQAGFIQLRKQLAGLGVETDRIIRCIHKNAAYYEGLAPEYLEYEMRILEKQTV